MKKFFWSVVIILMTTSFAWAKVKFISPVDGALSYNNKVLVQIKGCSKKAHGKAYFEDGSNREFNFYPMPYSKEWMAWIELPESNNTSRNILLSGSCGKKSFIKKFSLSSPGENIYLEASSSVARHFMHKKNPEKLSWDWGPAILLYGIEQMARVSQVPLQNDYLYYVLDYHAHYLQKGSPKIDWADKVAPALSAFELNRLWNYNVAMPQVSKAVRFLKDAKKNALGSLDHFGNTTFMAKIFPSTIWLDSLMMWGILATFYGQANHEEGPFFEWAINQPQLFYSKMRHWPSGLLYHAWHTKKDRPWPTSNVPWLRGNGWVLAAMAILLDDGNLTGRFQLVDSFVRLASSMVKVQMPNGLYDTLVASPGDGYEESSGSALVAFAFAKGYKLGLLDKSYLESAKKTFNALASKLIKTSHGYSFAGVSLPTMPYAPAMYKVIPRSKDITYGVGSFLLMSYGLYDAEAKKSLDTYP